MGVSPLYDHIATATARGASGRAAFATWPADQTRDQTDSRTVGALQQSPRRAPSRRGDESAVDVKGQPAASQKGGDAFAFNLESSVIRLREKIKSATASLTIREDHVVIEENS